MKSNRAILRREMRKYIKRSSMKEVSRLNNIKYAIVYLDLDPDYAKLNNLPVKLPLLAEDFQKARATNKIPLEYILRGLEAEVEVNKNNKYYLSYLVYYYYEAFKKCLYEENYEMAETYLNKAKEIYLDYRYYFYTGLYLKKLGNYEMAELNLKQCLKEKPNFAYGYFELGNLMFERKIYDEAIDNYSKAVEIEKDFTLGYLKIADVLIENARYEEAINYLQKCIEIDKNFISAYERLGVIFNVLQRYNDANYIHQKALEIDENNFQIYYNNAHSLARLARHHEAIESLEKALKLQETDYVLHELCLEYKNMGRYLDAIEVEERALEIAQEENINLIRITLLKLALIVEDEERFKKYFNSLHGTEFYQAALHLKILFDLSQGKINEVKETLLQNEEIVGFGLLFERLDNLDYYLDKLETNLDNEIADSIMESINEFGMIDPFLLSDNLEARGIKSEYLNWLKDLSDNPKPSPEGLEIVINGLLLSGFNYGLSERVAVALSRYLWKDGNGLAFGRLLLRFYQDRVFGDKASLEVFIEENIEEIKDMSFYFARIFAQYDDYLMDFDSLLEFEIKDFIDALKVFISAVRIEISKEEVSIEKFKDEKVRKLMIFIDALNRL